MRVARIPAWAGLALGLLPGLALAQDQAPTIDTGDTAWMLVSTALVLLMTIPGLALFYGGMVRSKNVLSVLVQVITVFSLLVVLWIVYGYSLAFSGEGKFVGDLSKMFLKGVGLESFGALTTIPEYVFFAFQGTFAAITVALIVGSFAERMRFSAVLIFAVLWFTWRDVRHAGWHGSWQVSRLGVGKRCEPVIAGRGVETPQPAHGGGGLRDGHQSGAA